MLKNLFLDVDLSLNSDIASLRPFLEKYEDDDWKRYISFDDKKYKRNVLYKGKFVEIVLICWKRGQRSDIHGHPKKGCLMKTLEGNLIEQIYNGDKVFLRQHNRKSGDIGFMKDNKILHKIINNSQDSFTLHIYPVD